MLEDFELPGLDELLDLLGDIAGMLDFDGEGFVELDQPIVPLWPGAGDAADFTDSAIFWSDLDAQPLTSSGGFAHEFGNIQLHNPFAEGLSSPIEAGSYDDLVARTAATTGISTSDFPN